MIDMGQKNAVCKNVWARPWNTIKLCQKIGMLRMGQKGDLILDFPYIFY